MIAQADAVRIPLPDKSVHCAVTSPPYWGLRKYAGNQGDEPLGLEPTPERHVERMVDVFREVRRVLRDDGVCFLNYGDSYASGEIGRHDKNAGGEFDRPGWDGIERDTRGIRNPIAQGNLMMMPHRVALALQADGWIVRQDLVWYKRNPMPESVNGWRWQREREKIADAPNPHPSKIEGGKDRTPHLPGSSVWDLHTPEYEYGDDLELKRGSWRHTRAHEYVFMLTKKMQYFSNQEAVREASDPKQEAHNRRFAKNYDNLDRIDGGQPGNVNNAGIHERPGPGGRNPRSVLDVPTQPYKGSHYATFPVNLIAPLIRATCPRRCCPVCGQGWAAVVEHSHVMPSEGWEGKWRQADPQAAARRMSSNTRARRESGESHDHPFPSPSVLGYKPTCEHLALSCTECGNVLEYLHAKTNPIMRQLRGQVSGPQSKPQVLLSEVLSRNEDDSTAGLRTVRKEFHPEVESAPSLLQQAMFGEGDSVDSAQHKGMVHNKQGLQTDIQSESSDGLEGGLRDGTSLGDGGTSRKNAQIKRGRASSEQNQGRQQDRKPQVDEQAKPRRNEEAEIHGNLSVVSNDLPGEGSCPRCGSQSLAFTIPDPKPGIVLDPFVGSGTTVKVAQDLLRKGIGIDISMEYLDLQAKVRIGQGSPSNVLDDLPLFQ